MRRVFGVLLFVTALLDSSGCCRKSAPSEKSQPPSALSAGAPIAALRPDGTYELAAVAALYDGKVQVTYGTGDLALLTFEQVIPISSRRAPAVGDSVLAAAANGKMAQGIVSSVTAAGYLVKWENGDSPIEVSRGRLVRRAPPNRP